VKAPSSGTALAGTAPGGTARGSIISGDIISGDIVTGGTASESGVASSAVFAYGGLTSVIATNVTQSRRALAGVAERLAAATSAVPAAKPAPSAQATARAQATSAPRATAPVRAESATLSCDTSYGMLPLNVTAIVSFLLAHGYSHNAAAGIAGNIYQESKGDPESVGMGGGGLIGFTPLPAGYVTGNAAADLRTQLGAVLTYNQLWAAYLPRLNSAATPADAAYVYVTDFERAGIPAAATREASAANVASACGL